MDTAVVRTPGQWLAFARDWCNDMLETPQALFRHTDAMEALLHAQQETSSRLASTKALTRAHQFTATFKGPHWCPGDERLSTVPADLGVDYAYQASGQVCFKGSLASILAPDEFGTYREPQMPIAPILTLYKLNQFKDMFPWVEYVWIYLVSLVTAHYLFRYYGTAPQGCDQSSPEMLGQKVQFDQRAIETNRRYLGVSPLSYSATTFNIGRYDAISLTVYLANTFLMRIDMGLIKPTTHSTEEGTSLT